MTKFISWNVNGIRASIRKGFIEFVEKYNPDILCIQETKARPEQVELDLPQYQYKFWNSAEKKGYSGTAVFSKIEPVKVINGMDSLEHDNEGRVIQVEFCDYYLVNVYTPNAKRELLRLPYRYKKWDPDFLNYISSLEKTKPVIFCGDLNVAHKEIDLANPKTNKTKNSFPGNAGFTDKERRGFDNILNRGFIDTFREFNSGPGHYSWWSYRANARERNIGWRIDYFCLSSQLRTQLHNSIILPDIMGSDHAPILMELN
jgi:exodeoxyribonuclease-3